MELLINVLVPSDYDVSFLILPLKTALLTDTKSQSFLAADSQQKINELLKDANNYLQQNASDLSTDQLDDVWPFLYFKITNESSVICAIRTVSRRRAFCDKAP